MPNRLLFNQRLKQACSDAQRGGERLALLFIDLDGFKLINDILGHAAGDHLLRQVALRLQGACLSASVRHAPWPIAARHAIWSKRIDEDAIIAARVEAHLRYG